MAPSFREHEWLESLRNYLLQFPSLDTFTNLRCVCEGGRSQDPRVDLSFSTICAEVQPMQIPPSDLHSSASLLCFISHL